MSEKQIEFKIPTNLAQAVDLYGETKAKRLAAQKQVDALEEQEKKLKQHLIDTVPKSEATGIAGKLWRIAVLVKERVIVDQELGGWEAYDAWCKKNKIAPREAYQHRLNEPAIKERIAAGKKIDGVRVDTYNDLSLKGAGK